MPDPAERHSKHSEDGWGSQPSRSQQRRAAAVEDDRPSPGRKNKAVCKAAHWKGPHQPVLRMRSFARLRLTCRWGHRWNRENPITWNCHHQEYCAGCGKILRDVIPAGECPDKVALTQDIIEGIRRKDREAEERLARWRELRRPVIAPVITGPQGYRKKKA